jgi:hypothetical protein
LQIRKLHGIGIRDHLSVAATLFESLVNLGCNFLPAAGVPEKIIAR